MNFEYHAILIRDIIISCCFALGVNVSNYLVLGKVRELGGSIQIESLNSPNSPNPHQALN